MYHFAHRNCSFYYRREEVIPWTLYGLVGPAGSPISSRRQLSIDLGLRGRQLPAPMSDDPRISVFLGLQLPRTSEHSLALTTAAPSQSPETGRPHHAGCR